MATEQAKVRPSDSYCFATMPNCPFDSMALLLQPVFMDVQAHRSSVQQQQPILSDLPHEPVSAKGSQRFFDFEDNLYTMWRVATKIKSVMADGARFENLTWRAWFQKTQLERADLEARRLSETAATSPQCCSEALPESAPCPLKSQATAIPRTLSPPIKPTGKHSRGYSAILAEIQQAGARRLSLDQAFIPTTHLNLPDRGGTPSNSPGPVPSRTLVGLAKTSAHPNTTTTTTTIPTSTSTSTTMASSEASAASDPSPTNNGGMSSARKKKKNVDRFIKKQHRSFLAPLEKITEITDEIPRSRSVSPHCASATRVPPPPSSLERRSQHEAISVHDLNEHERTYQGSSLSTTDTLSGASMSDLLGMVRRRKGDPQLRNSTASPKSDRSSVSLLTMLLSRNVDVRRPESCPPDSFPASPPCRPRAPLPVASALHSVTNETAAAAAATPSADLSPSRSSISYTTSDLSSGRSLGEPPLSDSSGSTRPATATNNRRRTVPNPQDFTAPLYIW